jgi:hypothetical protein
LTFSAYTSLWYGSPVIALNHFSHLRFCKCLKSVE